jgi:integrase
MASIFKRRLKDSKSFKWRAVVRIKGYPTVCETFDRKQEAEDWGKELERKIKAGQYNFTQLKQQSTLNDLVERFLSDGGLEHHRSKEDTLRHFDYWKGRMGEYALVHITAELIGKERKLLMETPTWKGTPRSPATTNRYMASLSSLLTYAVKRLKWVEENPCINMIKFKESSGRDRVLSYEEIERLLEACRQSRSLYLFCIVLIGVTTGARLGEILGLEWRHLDLNNKLAFLRETKNGRPRSIALSDEVVAELKALYDKRNPLKPLVFASKTAFGKIDIKKAWQVALERASIQDFHFHDIRHCFASLAASQGASNLELATAMGHRTLSMLQRYTHLDVEVTKKFSKQISEKLMQPQGESL